MRERGEEERGGREERGGGEGRRRAKPKLKTKYKLCWRMRRRREGEWEGGGRGWTKKRRKIITIRIIYLGHNNPVSKQSIHFDGG